MKRIIIVIVKKIVMLSLLLLPMSYLIGQNNQLSEAKIDSLIISLMNTRNVPGCVISVVSDTSVFYQQAFGYADLEKQEKVSLHDTRFFIGSVSKLITATGVVKAIEQGYIDANTDIAEYSSGLHMKRTFSDPITIKNLLSHTSGLDITSIGRKVKSPEEALDLKDFLNKYLPDQVVPPNKEMLYCNQGIAMSAYLVENTTGTSFQEYLQRNVFNPLQMGNSTFTYMKNAPHVSKGYDAKGKLQDIFLNNDWPAQMMITTAPDMANFMMMHLNGGRFSGKEVLSNSSIEQMHSRYFSYDDSLPGICLGFFEDNFKGNRSLWHDGSFTGFRTLCYLIPEQNIGVFISNNGENSSFNWALLHSLLPHIIAVEDVKSVVNSSEIDEGILGEYQNNRYSRSTFIKISALFDRKVIRAKENGLIEYNGQLYYRISPLRYKSVQDNKLLVFERNENGKISAMYTAYPMMRKFEKISGWQMSWVQLSLFMFGLIFSITSLIVLVRVKPTYKQLKDSIFMWITYIQQSAQFLTIFFLAIGFITANEQDYTLSRPPIAFLLSMSAGILLLLSTLPQLISFFMGIKPYSTKVKIFFFLSMIASWGFLLFMQNWNLLGFKY